jgi:hypothetical protein
MISHIIFFGVSLMVCLHLLVARLVGQTGVWVVVGCGVAGGIGAAAMTDASWCTIACTQGFFLMLYLHFFVGVDRSVSVRILNELTKGSDRTLSLDELESRYPRQHMFEHRIDLLVRKGWLLKEHGRYTTAPWILPLVGATRRLRRIFSIMETW